MTVPLRQAFQSASSKHLGFLLQTYAIGLSWTSQRPLLSGTVGTVCLTNARLHQHLLRLTRHCLPKLSQQRAWLCSTAEAGPEPGHRTHHEREALLERYPRARSLSASQKQRFHQLCDLLLERNRQVNLTAIRSVPQVYEKHFGDSLSLIGLIEQLSRLADRPQLATSEPAHLQLLDLGTGCGFPGLALAIACPDWHLVLLDSTRKKCDWLRDAIDVLQLPNVDVVWDRAELAAHRPEMRARFDLVVARAVARLAVLAELALPFVRVGGFFLAPKECFVEALPSCGGHWPELDSAMRAIALNGGRYELTAPSAPTLEQNEQISTNSNKTRVVVVIQKVEHTPLVYPRAPGRPQSQPL